MTMLQVQNSGPDIVASNFWDLPEPRAGTFFLSTNAATFRLLVPDVAADQVAEMKTAVEAVVSRGPWPAMGLRDAIEILFDDRSDSPFALQLSPESCDRLPPAADAGRRITLTVWTRGPVKMLELPCGFRTVPRIPCLEPWPEAV